MKDKKLFENGDLNDEAILELLKKLPEMYENGEIAEVQDYCLDIYNAIRSFEEAGEK